MNNSIYVLGIGHNSIAMIDLAEDCGYEIAGLYHYNNERTGENYFDFKIAGCTEDLLSKESLEGMNFLLTMGDNAIRTELYNKIIAKRGNVPTLVHPTATVSKRSQLGKGVLIMPQSIIQADVKIGDNSIVTLNTTISHSTSIGNNCFISGHNLIGAYVTIEDNCWIGQSCLVVSGTVTTIGHHSVLGAGSVLRNDMRPECLYLGSPARLIKRIKK